METLGSFAYSEEQRQRWRTGELADEWFRAYPKLFDEDDLRITRKQRDYHFFEWLAAIHIYHSIGWLSLVEKYRCVNHPRKMTLYGEFFPGEWQDRLEDFGPQMPDLLVYREDRSDFLLCEVKGRTDRLRPEQIEFFEAIAEVTGKPVYTVDYWELITQST